MSQNGLWLTYISAEIANEALCTPRKSGNPDTFLKRGARTSTRSYKQPHFGGERLDTELVSPEYSNHLQVKQSAFSSASKGRLTLQMN